MLSCLKPKIELKTQKLMAQKPLTAKIPQQPLTIQKKCVYL